MDIISRQFESDSPEDFLVSQWQKKTDRSVVYLTYRWLFAGFFIFSVIYSFAVFASLGMADIYFIYSTHLNLLATALMATLAAVLATFYNKNSETPKKMSKPLKFYWFLFIFTQMHAPFVTVVYWTFLFRSRINLYEVLTHMTNFAVLLIDVFVVKHRSRLPQCILPNLILFVYAFFFTWIYQKLGGRNKDGKPFVYPITNWRDQPWEAASIGVMAILFTVFNHFMLIALQRLRIMIHKKLTVSKNREIV